MERGPARRRLAVGCALGMLSIASRSTLAAPFAYVTNLRSGTVSVVDTASGTISDTWPVGKSPYGVAINNAGTNLYVSDVAHNDVSVVDTSTGLVSTTIPVGVYPIGLAVAPDDRRVYVAGYLSDTVSVIDTQTNTITASISVGSGPYGVAVSPVPSALLGGQGWELIADGGLARGAFATTILGLLEGDLYLLGSQAESAGALAGAFRYENGSLNRIATLSGQDYNRFLDYGAVEYNGGLFVGDRHGGKLYRINVAGDGSADVRQVALVGGEDVFPGPVLWGRLWLGTFGRLGTSPLNPGVYSYDGTVVNLAHEFLLTGPGGQVLSLIPHDGKLWATTREADGRAGRLWSSPDGFNWTREYNGTPYFLAEWRGELYGCEAAVNDSTRLPQFAVWRDGWVDVSAPFGTGIALGGILPVGAEMFAFDYYDGVWAFGGGFVSFVPGLGVFAGDGGVMSAKVHDGYLWVSTNQPIRLYRRRLAHRVYVTSFLDGTLSTIDPILNTVNASVAVGAGPLGVVVDPEGADVWVANFTSGTVSRVDVGTTTVTATVAVGTNPTGIAAAPGRVYVANYGDGTVSVVDTAANTVVTTVPVGVHPYGVSLTQDGTRIYVANQGDDTVSVIDTSTNVVVATIGVERRPTAFGAFTGGPAPTPCAVPGPDGCDDDDVCTVDSCTLQHGCLHTRIGGCCNGDIDCDDGTLCTGIETCVDNACRAGTSLTCDDGNPCTADLCNAASGCQHTSQPGSCDDHDACTVDDACTAGLCGGTPRVCTDGDVCTADGCDPSSGCTFTAIGGCCHTDVDCNDADVCTVDGCAPDRICQHHSIAGCCQTAADCDDDDPCTDDSCLGTLGCSNRQTNGGDATICRIDAIATMLDSASAGKLGGQAQKRQFARLIAAAHKFAMRPRGTGLRSTRLRLTDFVRRVERALRRSLIDPTVADRLLGLALDTISSLALRSAPGRR